MANTKKSSIEKTSSGTNLNFKISPKQKLFLEATADEVLYGGAAGGGKTCGQLIDAFLYAMKYRRSKQILFRRSFPELDKSVIRQAFELFPVSLYKYNSTSHTMEFPNGSILDFSYISCDADVYKYQSAEFDVIRFDELTHFTKFQYTYMRSRLRGTNGYPKQMKSSTNPGGIGHAWVKERFIDPAEYGKEFVGEYQKDENGEEKALTRIFIPAKVTDNKFLMDNDPGYILNLSSLPESQRKALRDGSWDIHTGQFFPEFAYDTHTIEPFEIPKTWRVYRTLDYGLDMLAVYWVAVDDHREIYVIRELCSPNMIISEAAKSIIENTHEPVYCTFAPPDMWGRAQESGKNKAQLFYEEGVRFTKSSNDREAGWLAIKELLKLQKDGTPKIHIFRTCTELIRCLPALVVDDRKPSDCAREPHEFSHSPDALRYFAIQWARPNPLDVKSDEVDWTADMWEDYNNATTQEERDQIIYIYGKPRNMSANERIITL